MPLALDLPRVAAELLGGLGICAAVKPHHHDLMQVGVLAGEFGHDLLQLVAGQRAMLGVIVAGHLVQHAGAARIIQAHRGMPVPAPPLGLPCVVDIGELAQARADEVGLDRGAAGVVPRSCAQDLLPEEDQGAAVYLPRISSVQVKRHVRSSSADHHGSSERYMCRANRSGRVRVAVRES